MERTRKCYAAEGQTDGQMKAISIIPHLLCSGGLKKNNSDITE